MWFWIIIIAVLIGGVLGFLFSDRGEKGEGALGGAMAGGCMAAGCVWRILLVGRGIIIVLKLFSFLFG